MKIETKFNVGDIVWWLTPFAHKVNATKITGIRIYVGADDSISLLYKHSKDKGHGPESEGAFYKTKREAKKNLIQEETQK